MLAASPLPDVFLTDLLMPGMGGRALVVALRRTRGLERTPVVLVTGSVHPSADFPAEGTHQALMRKPFDFDDVIRTVLRLAERAGSAAAGT